MKYTDLREDQKEHFDTVADYFGEDFPEDATHIDFDLDADVTGVLLKEDCMGNFYWDDFSHTWRVDNRPTTNFYQIPDKPWYNHDAVGFVDKVNMNEHGTTLSYKVMDYKEPLKYQETKFKPCKDTIKVVEQVVDDLPEKSTPTGGKSDYYLVEIPIEAPTIEIDHENGVVRFMQEKYFKYVLGNDFDRGNIAKANHRLSKKLGVNIDYDFNKIEHYANRIRSTSDGK